MCPSSWIGKAGFKGAALHQPDSVIVGSFGSESPVCSGCRRSAKLANDGLNQKQSLGTFSRMDNSGRYGYPLRLGRDLDVAWNHALGSHSSHAERDR